MNKPLISVVIPTKNGQKTIEKCLEGIKMQTLIDFLEVIVIDSGSQDNTIEIVQKYDFVRIYKINPQEFNHGATRNMGVELSKGDFVVMTVQDAWTTDNKWIEKMLKHFEDPNVALVVGQQVVPHLYDINPLQWYRPISLPKVVEVFFDCVEDFLALEPKQQYDVCFFDNVNSMYRKDVILKLKFDKMDYGEDMMLSKKLLMNRYKIVYDANCSVWHYHFLSKDYVYRSTFTELYFIKKVFDYIPSFSFSFKELFRTIYRLILLKASIKWFFHNINILIFRYLAYRDFIKYLKKGNNVLDYFYKKINPTVVQGRY